MPVFAAGPRRFLLDVFLASLSCITMLPTAAVAAQSPRPPVTFSSDVAPILFQHCASCHEPDGHAPFSVLTFADVRPRATQIAQAVQSRHMPPWKPEPGYGVFAGERRLTDGQVELITQWVRDGALEGSRAELPAAPPLDHGWQLGRPDLIVDLPEYLLPGGGADQFRNFVVPVAGGDVRYVRGLEFHANSPNVHHANIFVDPTTTSRQLDDEDPLPGYEGVIPYAAAFPDGHFLGWTSGQIAPLEPEEQAWRLPAGSSLNVQMHLMQAETPQRLRPSIGLYFSTRPPTRTPAMLRLGRQNLDIAPGDASYLTEDSYVLPVEAEIQAVQPHAHQRAKEVRAWATLPDGSRHWLIYISQWDFGWQDQYRYASPFWLPAGTRLTLQYVFDNSAGNRRNPDSPPRRVLWGQRSSDEMADLWVQMSTRSEAALTRLSTDLRRKMILEDIAGHELELRSHPDSIIVHNDVAVLYLESGRAAQAVTHFAVVSRLQPVSATAHFNLAAALEQAGLGADALTQYREAVRLDPSYERAVRALANALLITGDLSGATVTFRQLLAINPGDAESYNNLGFCQIQTGDLAAAMSSLQRALDLRPAYADAHYNLAHALARQHRSDEAVAHLREAVRLRDDWAPAMSELSWLLATSSRPGVRQPEEAIRIASRAAALTRRQDAEALAALAAAYAAAGRYEDASTTAAEAMAVVGVSPELVARLGRHAQTYRSRKAITDPEW